MQKNKEIQKAVNDIMKKNAKNETSENDGVLVLCIYKKGKKKPNIDSRVLINGFTPDEVDIAIREVYARVYEYRKRNDKKTQEIDKKLKKAKGE